MQLWKQQKGKDEDKNRSTDNIQTDNKRKGEIQIQSFKRKNEQEKEMIGEFISIMKSMSGLTLKSPALILSSGFGVGTIVAFTNQHFFNPAEQYYILMLLILLDNITGMYIALKKEKFCTSKAKRTIYTLIGHTAILFFAFKLGQDSKTLFFLKDAVFVPLVLINLLSFVKNLSLLGYLPKTFAKYLYKKVNTYDNQLAIKNPDDLDSGSGNQ